MPKAVIMVIDSDNDKNLENNFESLLQAHGRRCAATVKVLNLRIFSR